MAASAFAVESANTVGYTEKAITGDQWYMIGIQFKDVGTQNAAISFDDLIQMSGVTASTWVNQDTEAAEIQYFNGVGYDHFYYISDAFAEGTETELGSNCWALDGVQTSLKKGLGEGFWFKAPAAAVGANAKLTLKGEVKEVAATPVSFSANTWKIVANPFPVAVGLQNVVTTGITASKWENQDTEAAEIQYFNGIGYDHFYYISDAFAAGTETELGADCWALDGVQPSGTQIPVGAAFWLKAKQDGSITFSL